MFKYSARAGTPAAELEGFPEELIEERHLECLEVMERLAVGNRGKWVGTVQEVLVEEERFGRTRGNARVAVQGECRVGETVKVRIRNSEKTTFDGEVIYA